MNFDVVIIGGGAAGSAAGIQSSRLGAKTLIIEETPWLGGMITSAGVSAFDGNKYAMGGGIFGELRKMIEEYYGSSEKTYTGWISLTCFEPKVGKQLLTELAEKEKNLTVWYQCKLLEVEKVKNKITSVTIKKNSGEAIKVYGKVFIEATEWGDVLALGKVPYRLGRDTKEDTGEVNACDVRDMEIQDMTYCAILKKYDGIAPKVEPSEDYDENEFINSVREHSDTDDENYLNHKLHDWKSFISYAALPNDKYLLNWPFRANDYHINSDEIFEKPETRAYHFNQAKKRTLNYIHYIQTKLNHPEWGLATNEFPTSDYLPFIPYVRESRRVKGLYLMVESDVVPLKNSYRPKWNPNSIAVGDYFLDHHHSSFFHRPEKRLKEHLPSNAPFQVPFQSLIPIDTDGLVVAEKSISVSHIVNGCTRLQPVVMLIGQAAGAIAALASGKSIEPKEVNIEEIQNVLIDAGCQIFPYKDLWNYLPYFKAIQKLSLKNIWIEDNDFNFEPQEMVTRDEIEKVISKIPKEKYDAEIINKLQGESRDIVYPKIYDIFFK